MHLSYPHRFFSTLCLAAFLAALPLSAHAVVIKAKGKDAATAALNAKVSAVRASMQEMAGAGFLKQNMAAVRSAIILRAADFARSAAIVEARQENGLTLITADVDLDLAALAAALKKLGADVALPGPAEGPVPQPPAAAPEDTDPGLKKLTDGYMADMRALFGDAFRMRPQSEPIPLPGIKPVTESLEFHAGISHVPESIKSGGGFWFRWDNTDGQDRGRMWLCRADAPMGTQEELDRVDISSWNLDGSQGLLHLDAPVSPGAYELRLFPDRDGKTQCIARAGFTVTVDAADIPAIRPLRNCFVPEEEIFVELNHSGKFPEGLIVIAKPADAPVIQRSEIKTVSSTKRFRELSGTHITIAAPREPGRYAFYIFPQDKDVSLAIAALPFEVRQPKDPEKAMLAVQPYLYSSERPRFFARSAPEWEWERMEWQIRPKGEYKNWKRKDAMHHQGMDLNKVNLSNSNALSQFYEPGTYTVFLFNADAEKEGSTPFLQKDFTVLPAPRSAAVKPSLSVSSQEVGPGDSVRVCFTARQEWPDRKDNASWIGLVPKGAPSDAPGAFGLAKKNMYKTARHMEGSYDFNVDEGPGQYELRMYDGTDESARLQASVPITVLTEDRIKAQDAAVEKAVEAYLTGPVSPPVQMDGAMLRRQFRVPKIRNSAPSRSAPAGNPTADSPFPAPDGGSVAGGMDAYALSPLPVLVASAARTQGGICSACGSPRILSDSPRPLVIAAARDTRCDSYIDEEVKTMRLVDITLGRDNQLKSALWDAAIATLTKFPVKGDKAQQLQKVINIAYDTYSHGTAGIDAYESGDYLGAAQNAFALVLKGAVNLCDSKDCFESVRSSGDEMLKNYLSKCSDGEYKALLQKASQELGDKSGMMSKIESLRTGADHALNVDVGTAASKGWDSQDYADMLWTLGEGAVTTAWPPSAVIIAAAKVTKQGALAVRDFIVDDSTQTLYKAYKENMDGGAGQEDFVRAFSTRNNWYSLAKARQVMAANLHKPEVLKSLSKGNLAKARAGTLSADDLDQSEIWGFLHKQFDVWMKAEKSSSDFANYANSLRDDYKNMECNYDFDKSRTPQNKGVTDRMSSWWNDYCPDEVARFRDYVKARADIENELKRWAIGGKNDRCVSSGNLRESSRDMLCTLVQFGRDAYLDRALDEARYCGWKLGDDSLGKFATEKTLLKREANVVKTLTAIGRKDILNCLCGQAGATASGVYYAYDPTPHPDASPSCGHSSPPCLGGNWGCFRFPMNTSQKALEACGAYESLRQWKSVNGPVDR